MHVHARVMESKDSDLSRGQSDGVFFVNLPTELLVKILSYLPIRDKIRIRYVSRRFQDVIEMPLLWKDFLWPDYEPRHVRIVRDTLKAHGRHVRRIVFPAHVKHANVLEMARFCTSVTHLRFPKNTQLSLEQLEEIVHTLTQLQQLDVFTSDIKCIQYLSDHEKAVKQFLEVAATRVKSLILRIDLSVNHQSRDQWRHCDPCSVLSILEKLCPLPPVVNIFINLDYLNLSSCDLEFNNWLPSADTPHEICLYDIDEVTMDLHPSIPLRQFHFSPAAIPYLIKLSDYGILGLENDIFYFTAYNHYGEVRHSIAPKYQDLHAIKDQYLHCISNLNAIANVDLSHHVSADKIYPGHLEQLAIACPNLQRLNLTNVGCCLQSLQGLRAIVDACQNLQGLSLVGIPVSLVESYLLLWELLSSIKKLTHLAIDLCMLIQASNCDSADRQRLIDMFRNCDRLKALEIIQTWHCTECNNVPDVEDLLFCHFPSLVFVRLSQVRCTTAMKYAITNCHRLKYLSYGTNLRKHERCVSLPSSSSCHLHQLCIESSQHGNLSAPSVRVLSAHGKLEYVVFIVRSITTSAITTLIDNSPNLILLCVVTKVPLCDENGVSVDREEYKDTVSKTFSYHKLLTAGNFSILQYSLRFSKHQLLGRFCANLNSLWNLP